MKKDFSNYFTLLLTSLIIAAGIILPSLIYPLLDPFLGQTSQLEVPADSESSHVLDELFPLYPWNVYDIRDTAPLTYGDRQFLQERGVPDYLLTMLTIRSMPIDESAYYEHILSSFTYLIPLNEMYPPCYVLVGCDIDQDGRPDIQCAVDLEGDIIDFQILNPQWAVIDLSFLMEPEDETKTDDTQSDGGTLGSEAIDAGEGTNADVTAGSDSTATTEPPIPVTNDPATPITDPNNQTGDKPAGLEPDDDTGQEDSTPIQLPPITGSQIDLQPAEEDLAIWTFTFATTMEANRISQGFLARSFNQIDLYYCSRYTYSFQTFLVAKSGQIPEQDNLVYVNPLRMNPQSYSDVNNILIVYDLRASTRIILYVDARTGNCLGFNIQKL